MHNKLMNKWMHFPPQVNIHIWIMNSIYTLKMSVHIKAISQTNNQKNKQQLQQILLTLKKLLQTFCPVLILYKVCSLVPYQCTLHVGNWRHRPESKA